MLAVHQAWSEPPLREPIIEFIPFVTPGDDTERTEEDLRSKSREEFLFVGVDRVFGFRR
jgi:hypothetical protein